jgi:glycosyltransferase involved in cell wall biosynthesis
VYAQNLIDQFKNIAKAREDVRFCLFTSHRDSNDARLIEPDAGFELSETPLLDRDRLWRLAGVNLAAARAHADLLFSPTSNILPIGSVPVVCTIHDVTPIVLPSHSRKITLMMRCFLTSSAKLSRALITDSHNSKEDLLNICQLPESKVSVVYLGYDKNTFNDALPDSEVQKSLHKQLGIARPYILHHGVIQPRKNLKRLIDAYRLLLSRNRNLDLDLVLVGQLGWEYEGILAASDGTESTRGRVILPGPLTGPNLAQMIKGASLVVIPSLYEGFCLPMIEAMACGTPTITADASCLPEVSGGVLRYFDPLSVDDMASCMERVLESEQLKSELAQRGKCRAAYFDWRRCAEETLQVFSQNVY